MIEKKACSRSRKFAHGLIFNQGSDLFRVVYIAVVEYEHTSGPQVRVSERNDELLKELKEVFCGD